MRPPAAGTAVLRAAAVAATSAVVVLLAAPGTAGGETPAAATAAQEADAVAPRAGQGRAPDTVPAGGGTGLPPVDSLTGPGPRGQELDDLTAKVASRLRCPVCRSQSVLESSATLSQQMQREIRRRLAAGETPEQVEDYFVSRYGEWILLKPEPEGINLLVYLLPAAALLGGGLLVWTRVREWVGASDGHVRSSDAAVGAAGEDAADESDAARRERAAGTGGGLTSDEEERIDELIRRREADGG